MKGAGWLRAHYIDVMPHNPLGPWSAPRPRCTLPPRAQLRLAEARVTQTENLYYGQSGVNLMQMYSSPYSHGWQGPCFPSRLRPAWASKSTRCWRRPSHGACRKRLTGAAQTAR